MTWMGPGGGLARPGRPADLGTTTRRTHPIPETS